MSGSLDTSIRVWDVESGNCLHTLIGHQSLTSGMELKDNLLISGNADSTVKVWDITTGQCLQTLQGWSCDKQSYSYAWHAHTHARTHTYMHALTCTPPYTHGCPHTQSAICKRADESFILSGPNKHQSAVTCLQFNKKFVITSSDDGSVKIWDLKCGDFLRNLVALDSGGSGGVVWRIRCSNTKLVCAVGSRNGTEETKLLVLDFDVDDDVSKPDISDNTPVAVATHDV